MTLKAYGRLTIGYLLRKSSSEVLTLSNVICLFKVTICLRESCPSFKNKQGSLFKDKPLIGRATWISVSHRIETLKALGFHIFKGRGSVLELGYILKEDVNVFIYIQV